MNENTITVVDPFTYGKFIPLIGKRPEGPGSWQQHPGLTPAQIEARVARGLNIGFVPQFPLFIIDLDVKQGGNIEQLIDECIERGYLPDRTVLANVWQQSTPSGGRHFIMRLPDNAQIVQKVNVDPTLKHGQLDVRVPGRGYIVIAPSAGYHASHQWNEHWPMHVLVQTNLLAKIQPDYSNKQTSASVHATPFKGKPSNNLIAGLNEPAITRDKSAQEIIQMCKQMLDKLPRPDVGVGLRDMWRNAAWSLQHIAEHRQDIYDELRELWIEWSMTGKGAPGRAALEIEWQRLEQHTAQRGPTNTTIGAQWLMRQTNTVMPFQVEPTKKLSNETTGRGASDKSVQAVLSSNRIMFIKDNQDTLYIVPTDPSLGLRLAHRLDSERGRALVFKVHQLELNQIVRPNNKQDLLWTVEQEARDKAPVKTVVQRAYTDKENIYIDLGNDRGEALVIGKGVYEITTEPAIYFTRSELTSALPTPSFADPHALNKLYDLFALSKENRLLATHWLLNALRGTAPYQLCVLSGGAGAAKSTFARVLRRLVDPIVGEQLYFSSQQKLPQTLPLLLNKHYVVPLDNMTKIDADILNMLCVIATGGRVAERKLYTNNDMVENLAARPIIITTIQDVPRRGDMVSRMINIELSSIPPSRRIPETRLWDTIETMMPNIMGVLVSMLAHGCRDYQQTEQRIYGTLALPRLAETAIWSEACGVKNAVQKLLSIQNRMYQETLATNPVVTALLQLIDQHDGDLLIQAADLHKELKKFIGRVIPLEEFPPNHIWLARKLRSVENELVSLGITCNLNVRKGKYKDRHLHFSYQTTKNAKNT